MGAHEAVGDGQAEPGPLSGRLGGEERLEDPLADLGGTPGPSSSTEATSSSGPVPSASWPRPTRSEIVPPAEAASAALRTSASRTCTSWSSSAWTCGRPGSASTAIASLATRGLWRSTKSARRAIDSRSQGRRTLAPRTREKSSNPSRIPAQRYASCSITSASARTSSRSVASSGPARRARSASAQPAIVASGLRISCATPAARRPAAASFSVWAIERSIARCSVTSWANVMTCVTPPPLPSRIGNRSTR